MPREEKKQYNVTVLSRREISVFPEVGREVKQFLISYVAAGLPPATVIIDKTKWSKENEKRFIRADIERRLKQRPETYQV